MSNNANTNLIAKNILKFFNFKNLKINLNKSIGGLIIYAKETRYKFKNLFMINLTNGLNNLYSEYYRDSLIRFYLMNLMWRNNPIINYNLGRSYYHIKKYKKALNFFKKAVLLHKEYRLIKSGKASEYRLYNEALPLFFIKKINKDGEITDIPIELKEEFYNYSLRFIFLLKEVIDINYNKLFSIYNHYIWLYAKNTYNKEVHDVSFKILDIGAMTGNLGEILKKEYSLSEIHALDVSKEHCDFLKFTHSLNEFGELDEVSINDKNPASPYSKIINAEMHMFLNKHYIEKVERSKSKEDYDLIFSMGTFSEFGKLDVILNLCAANLKENGLLIFYLNRTSADGIQFSTTYDCFFYTKLYILEKIKDNFYQLELLDENIRFHNDEQKILVVLKKVMYP